MRLPQQLAAVISLWLAGVALRLTILAIPPVITLIRDDLSLSGTEVGVLTGLPVSLFAVAAVLGSLLIARVGAMSALLSGLVITAIGSALRAASTEAIMLYATTTVMALGVAIMQPALPPLVRSWLPGRIGFGTAVYTNGLLAGEIAPVVFTPFVLPLMHTSWRLDLVLWSVPVLAIAVSIATVAPRESGRSAIRMAWWPDWSSGLVWRLGLIFGSVTSTYFTINGFLPLYLNSVGRPDQVKSALIALNVGQLPASFLLIFAAGYLVRRVWPYIWGGIAAFVCMGVIVSSTGLSVMIASAVLGFSCGLMLTLVLALPPLLCAPEDVARTSAALFTLAYGCAVIVPIVSGALWDLTGIPGSAFLPIALCALLPLLLATGLDVRGGSERGLSPG
jgi:MFS transporter, CP family, cyanate transporter